MAFVALAVVLLVSWRPSPGTALPVFTHQYQVSCSKCHSVIPHLNEFGAAFLANGYRIPGVKPGNVIPLSIKANIVDSSENQGEGPDYSRPGGSAREPVTWSSSTWSTAENRGSSAMPG